MDWQVVGNKETIAYLEESCRLSQKIVINNKKRVAAGSLNKTSLKLSEVQLALTRQELWEAQMEEHRLADQVKSLLNLNHSRFEFMPADQPASHKFSQSFEELLPKVLENSTPLAQLNSTIQQNQYQLMEAENQLKPNLDLNLQFDSYGMGSSSDKASERLNQSKLNAYSVGLTWSIPLFDKKPSKKISNLRLEHAQIHLQKKQLTTDLKIQLQSLLRNLELRSQDIENNKASVALSRDLLNIEIRKSELGEGTGLSVAQAQEKFDQAKKNKILADIKYEETFISLLILSGDIYAFYQLDVG